MNKLFTFIFLTTSFAYSIGGDGPLDQRKKGGLVNERPHTLDQIGIDENLGGQVDLSLTFQNEQDETVKLGDYFTDKPVFLMLIYYNCPTLCNTHLNTLVKTLSTFEWQMGKEYEYVIVSIDPEEGPAVASLKKENYLKLLNRPGSEEGWHFLTGEEVNIKQLANQIGFRYVFDTNSGEWNHVAAGYVLTPKGRISYYHYGLDINPKVFRLSLVEASENKIGNVMDRLVLYCLQYDPNKKTYAFYAYNAMKVAAGLMVLVLVLFFGGFWLSQRKVKSIEEDKKEND